MIRGLSGCVLAAAGAQGEPKTLTVRPGQQSATVQAAVDAAPETEAVIRVKAGMFCEVIHVDKGNIRMVGEVKDPAKVEVVFERRSEDMRDVLLADHVRDRG